MPDIRSCDNLLQNKVSMCIPTTHTLLEINESKSLALLVSTENKTYVQAYSLRKKRRSCFIPNLLVGKAIEFRSEMSVLFELTK